MMGSRNMLSVKKVKLHGMTSTKWTTKDKITQYKGLINLYSKLFSLQITSKYEMNLHQPETSPLWKRTLSSNKKNSTKI